MGVRGSDVDQKAIDAARASYARCRDVPEFFAAFYDEFFATCPAAKPMFARTDFERQHRLLRHAIGLLLLVPTQPSTEPSLLRRVAERHSRRDLDVHPEMYEPFIECLIATVERFDPEFTPETARAWRVSVAEGVRYMKSKY